MNTWAWRTVGAFYVLTAAAISALNLRAAAEHRHLLAPALLTAVGALFVLRARKNTP